MGSPLSEGKTHVFRDFLDAPNRPQTESVREGNTGSFELPAAVDEEAESKDSLTASESCRKSRKRLDTGHPRWYHLSLPPDLVSGWTATEHFDSCIAFFQITSEACIEHSIKLKSRS